MEASAAAAQEGVGDMNAKEFISKLERQEDEVRIIATQQQNTEIKQAAQKFLSLPLGS